MTNALLVAFSIQTMLTTNVVTQHTPGWTIRYGKSTNAVAGPRHLVEATIITEVKTLSVTIEGHKWPDVSETNLVSYVAKHYELQKILLNEYENTNKGPFQLNGAQLIPLPEK
jgi:hypothetical protein